MTFLNMYIFLYLKRVKCLNLNKIFGSGGGVLKMYICKSLILQSLLKNVYAFVSKKGCIRDRGLKYKKTTLKNPPSRVFCFLRAAPGIM